MGVAEYGTWTNQVDARGRSLTDTVDRALVSGDGGFDVALIVRDYEQAVDDALPDGVSLCGNKFYGPYPRVDVDIAGAVASVDLWEIVFRHRR